MKNEVKYFNTLKNITEYLKNRIAFKVAMIYK